eukprot:m.24629 g.24629  ORF g.24629 m.24629 type:complete len:58 (+) comp28658_c1_seq1:780-953(+)
MGRCFQTVSLFPQLMAATTVSVSTEELVVQKKLVQIRVRLVNQRVTFRNMKIDEKLP